MLRERRSDVLIIGAGPAGLAAAKRAALSGRRVIVLDDNPEPGGQIWRRDLMKGTFPSVARLRSEAEAAGALFEMGSPVFHAEGPHRVFVEDAVGVVAYLSDQLILACGARELFLPFPGWTLPGVYGAGGLQALVKGGGDVSGWKIVVAGSGPLLLAVAAMLISRGAEVVRLTEQAQRGRVLRFGVGLVRHPKKLAQGLSLLTSLRGVRRTHGVWPVAAFGAQQLEAVALGTERQHAETVACDALACGFGLVPNVELAMLLNARVEGGRVVVDEWQRTTVPHVLAAGEQGGIGGVEAALLEGEIAGAVASGDDPSSLLPARDRARRFAQRLAATYALDDRLRALPEDSTMFCRCEDVLFSAVREFGDARAAKLHTRAGMGACQGRVCGAAGSFLIGWDPPRPRPPLCPVRLESLAHVAEPLEPHAEDLP